MGLVLVAILLVSIAAPLAAIYTYQDLTDRAIQAYPLVSPSTAANLSDGSNVRVWGQITQAVGNVAALGVWQPCGKSFCWVFTWNNFEISDGNASLIVDTSGVQNPSEWGTAPVQIGDPAQEQEWVVGDWIAVEGTIGSPGVGKVLEGQGIAQSATSFWAPWNDYVAEATIALTVAGVAVGVVYYLMAHGKVRLHRQKLATPGAFHATLDDAPPTADDAAPETVT